MKEKYPFVFTKKTVFEEYAPFVEICSEEEAYEGTETVPQTAEQEPAPGKKSPEKILRSVLLTTVKWAAILFCILIFSVLFNIYCIRMNQVNGESMMPTLENGQKIISTRLPYVFGSPQVGDIVIFDTDFEKHTDLFSEIDETLRYNIITVSITGTEDDSVLYVKRVVAVAGDRVEFLRNKFYRNGEEISEDYLLDKNVYTYPVDRTVIIPEGYVFVMGDNRNDSTDSRVIGCVPLDKIIGKVIS